MDDDLLKNGKYEEYYTKMKLKFKRKEITESEFQKCEKLYQNYRKIQNFKKKDPSDLYSILEVQKNATQDEIKKAYNKLLRIYHPDSNKIKESNDCFAMINQAYLILGDKKKRVEYDQKLKFGSTFNRGTANNFGYRFNGTISEEDIFNEIFSNIHQHSTRYRFNRPYGFSNQFYRTYYTNSSGLNEQFNRNFNINQNNNEEIDFAVLVKVFIIVLIFILTRIL